MLSAALTATAAIAPTGTVYTTQVVTAYTTYCPLPTQFAVNNVTYTAGNATTLTVTNCPCTVINNNLVTSQVPVYQPTPAATSVYTRPPPSTTASSLVSYTGAADAAKPVGAMLAMGLLAFL